METQANNATSDAPEPEMDARTLTALRGSIRKWELILAGTERDMGSGNCPLCAEFMDQYDEPDGDPEDRPMGCAGCPVRIRTGEEGCADSPYMDWSHGHKGRDTFDGARWFGYANETPEDAKLAQAELEFLRSLLPAGAGSTSGPTS